jgi:hypothetical protein
VLGPEHPDVATRVDNLAMLCRGQSRLAEAEPLFKRALAIDQGVLGPEQPDLATELNNLASWYRDQAIWPKRSRSTSVRLQSTRRHSAQSIQVLLSTSIASPYCIKMGHLAEAGPLYKARSRWTGRCPARSIRAQQPSVTISAYCGQQSQARYPNNFGGS